MIGTILYIDLSISEEVNLDTKISVPGRDRVWLTSKGFMERSNWQSYAGISGT